VRRGLDHLVHAWWIETSIAVVFSLVAAHPRRSIDLPAPPRLHAEEGALS